MTCSPRGGYSSPQKRHYRREVWAFIERTLRDSNRNGIGRNCSVIERNVLVLESSAGLEVEELLRRGYSSSHIHIVNDSPAIVATVQRRYASDARTTGALPVYGVPLCRALSRLRDAGVRLDAANLDFTGCLTPETLDSIRLCSSLMSPGGCLVVTVQRGRETGEIRDLLASPGDGDIHRADALRVALIARTTSIGSYPHDTNGCQWHIAGSRWNVYRGDNSRVSMMWVGMQLIGHATPRLVHLYSVFDPFLPHCVHDALSRRPDMPITPRTHVVYAYEDGRGIRKFVDTGDAAAVYLPGGGKPHAYSWTRPALLDKWARRRVR